MPKPDRNIRTVAIVGAGLIGLGWSIVFAKAGCRVLIYDSNAETLGRGLAKIDASLADMKEYGLIADGTGIMANIGTVSSLQDAVTPADYVQESVLERVDIKTRISAEISPLLKDGAVVGSSSSGIPASAFTEGLKNRDRFLIVHPVNPPHLIPLVELVPAPWTDPQIIPWIRAEMARLGQSPIVVNREIEGFILNRLQGALLNEAWALFEQGYASAADIDSTVANGLGLRWSFMGPFETIDLNAPGGIDDYAQRLGPLYHSIALSRSDPQPWGNEAIARATLERRGSLPEEDLSSRSSWRDRRLMALIAHRKQQPS